MFFPSSKPAGIVFDSLTGALVVSSGVLVGSLIAYGLGYSIA